MATSNRRDLPRDNQSRGVVPLAVLIASTAMALGGCRAIGDIFKAGVWVGVVLVVFLVGLIGGGIALFSKK